MTWCGINAAGGMVTDPVAGMVGDGLDVQSFGQTSIRTHGATRVKGWMGSRCYLRHCNTIRVVRWDPRVERAVVSFRHVAI